MIESFDEQEMALRQDFYDNYYEKVFFGGYLVKLFNISTHKSLERGLDRGKFPYVLEIGAGKGEHFQFVKHDFDYYVMVDKKNYLNAQELDPRIEFRCLDIRECNFEVNSFDRIIVTCVLHHLDDPLLVLKKIKSWVKPEGVISLFLPHDPGFANRILRKFFVVPRTKYLGFKNYDLINALEHKNSYWGLIVLLKHIFGTSFFYDKKYPINLPWASLTTYSIIHIKLD